MHEAFFVAVEQISARAAQPFFDNGAGDARVRACDQSRGVKLHHFHIAQRQPGTQCHRHAVAGFVARRRVKLVHGRPAAGGEQYRLRLHEHEFTAADIDHQHAGKRIACFVFDELHRAMLFHAFDSTRPHLLGQPVHDLDAGQVALVYRAIKRLPGERFLMNGAIGIAIEKTAQFVFKFMDTLNRSFDQRPREILIRQPLAAFDGIHEMTFD